MGKAARNEPAKVKVLDAAHLLQTLREFATGDPLADLTVNWLQRSLNVWARSKVVLRLDPDFAVELARSDDSSALPDGWSQFLPFEAFAVSLPVPLVTERHGVTTEWFGFLAVGAATKPDTSKVFGSLLAAPEVYVA